jgi:hypothetical protein
VTYSLSQPFDAALWRTRLADDKRRVHDVLPPALFVLHDIVVARAQESGAEALLLTGSTARNTRTAISDLDYHVAGSPISKDDLPDELDLHVVSPLMLKARLLEGDDFTQWSLRFGCVVFDNGIVRESAQLIADQQLWPDPTRKRTQAGKSLRIARAMVESGDSDAAVEQVRTALTLTARWRLLEDQTFPLSRAELPAQLKKHGYMTLANGLAATIRSAPPLDVLGLYVDAADELIHGTDTEIGVPARSHAA